jgi:tripartite-type tricarboxylate transporter receptor subunit TctC
MSNLNFRRRRLLAALSASPWTLSRAVAQTAPYPNRPVRIVLPATVGSTSDLIMRAMSVPVGTLLGEPLVIDARGGAAGKIAVDHVAGSAPDGYTLLLANNGTQAIMPSGRGTSPAELGRSLLPVTMLVRSPIVVAVNPRLKADTLGALVELAKARPKALSYASSGAGSTSHMASMMLTKRAGIELQHVPYASSAAGVRDVLSGEVPVIFTQLGAIGPLVQAGQLRAIVVMGERRLSSFPDVETIAEAGFPGLEISTWYGVVVPAGTPRAIVERLHAVFVRALAAPDLRRQFATFGMEAVGDTPEQFAVTLDTEVRRWSELVRAHGDAGDR